MRLYVIEYIRFMALKSSLRNVGEKSVRVRDSKGSESRGGDGVYQARGNRWDRWEAERDSYSVGSRVVLSQ